VEYTREEAQKIDTLRRSISDKIIGNIKVVEIENLDLNACGGFHVNETKMIGLFKIINYEKVKKNFTRIYYKAGKLAYEDYYKKHDILKIATTQLSSTMDIINKKINIILEENKSKNRELNNLYSKYSELVCEKLKKEAKEVKGKKVIIYNKNDEVTKFFPKYIPLNEFSIIYGKNGDFTVISNEIDCLEIKKDLEKEGIKVKGGGNSNRVTLKFQGEIEKLITLFMKYML
jgi:alanyl-tRNA synthetase